MRHSAVFRCGWLPSVASVAVEAVFSAGLVLPTTITREHRLGRSTGD